MVNKRLLANSFLIYFEKNWLQNYPSDFKAYYYRQYVDDIINLFNSSQHLEVFQNGRQDSMSFTLKIISKTECAFLK